MQNKIFSTSTSKLESKSPISVSFTEDKPFRKDIKIKGAQDFFYLNMNEAYNNGWLLGLKNKGLISELNPVGDNFVPQNNHHKLDGYLNTWYVNVKDICSSNSSSCKLMPNGRYDIEMVAYFKPQIYYYFGVILSFIIILIYINIIIFRKKLSN